MKTMADRILADATISDPELRMLRDALVRPAVNHVAIRDVEAPMIERFVVGGSEFEQLCAESVELSFEVLACARMPLPRCWIETHRTSGSSTGYFCATVDDCEFVDVVMFNQGRLGRVCRWFRQFGQGWEVAGVQRGVLEAKDHEEFLVSTLAQIELVWLALSTPRAATVERVVPPQGPSVLRKFQRGRYVFSYNIVRTAVPETSKQGHVVRAEGAHSPKRGHWVIGHWRLLDGKPEPAWIWIEGHKSGDESLGFVLKERHLAIGSPSALRRGFVVPGAPGVPGMKIKARRAH